MPDARENVACGALGDAGLVGTNPFSSDAGVASILVETPPGTTTGEEPVVSPDPVRAALVAGGRVVARIDEAVPKFRVRGSTAPTTREPFHRR